MGGETWVAKLGQWNSWLLCDSALRRTASQRELEPVHWDWG